MTSRIEGGPIPLLQYLPAVLVPIGTNTGFVVGVFKIIYLLSELLVEPNVGSILRALN